MMKTATWIVTVLCAWLAQVEADGICYDANHNGGTSIPADAQLIKNKGFSHVRTYIVKYGSTNLAMVLGKAGLRVMAGIPFPDGSWRTHLEAAKEAAAAGYLDSVLVGNENLAGKNYVPGDMINAINEVKGALKQWNVPVGTSQRTTELASKSVSGLDSLIGTCSFIGANIHPFFTDYTTGASGIKRTDDQWKSMLNANPSLNGKLRVTESGWPTKGWYGHNEGTIDGARAYMNAFKSWGGPGDANKYMFQMFDIPTRTELYEQNFGIMYPDSKEKLYIGGSGASYVAPPAQTPPPATTIPSTTKPSTTKPATTVPATTKPSTTAPATTTPVPKPTTTVPVAAQNISSKPDVKGLVDGSHADNLTSGSKNVGASIGDNILQAPDGTTSKTETNPGTDESAQTNGGAKVEPAPNAAGDAPENVEQVNTQGSAGAKGGFSMGAIIVLGCASVVGAAGFIYKTRKAAEDFEDDEYDMKGGSQLTTPTENICVL